MGLQITRGKNNVVQKKIPVCSYHYLQAAEVLSGATN